MRAAVSTWLLAMSLSVSAVAQQKAPEPAGTDARSSPASPPTEPTAQTRNVQPLPAALPSQSGGAAPFPATPAPSPPTNQREGEYLPVAPARSATTHPQPTELRVWRLVDPVEFVWHAEDPQRPRGWFRVDLDAAGTTGYFGGSYWLAQGVAFAPFAVGSASSVQPNLALTWQLGGLWLMPALGTSLDFRATRALSVDPQLLIALDAKLIYLEAWSQFFLGTIYHARATNTFKGRAMLLLSLSSTVGVGAEYDPTLAVSDEPGSALLSSIVGGRTNLRIGGRSTLGLFLGYQTVRRQRVSSEGVAGRLEFVQQW